MVQPLIDPTSVQDALRQLAGQIRQWREAQHDLTVEGAARSIGVSRGTWMRMEHGEPGVRVDAWLSALRVTGTLDAVLQASEPNLFDLVVDHYYPGFG